MTAKRFAARFTAPWNSGVASVRSGTALPWLFLAAFYVFTLCELRRAYLSKGFNYHDLGLINDFMSSAWHGRGFFHVFDAGINHLGWLFTPTMILFTPLHALCDSQFTLIAWLTTASFAGYAFLLAAIRVLLERSAGKAPAGTGVPALAAPKAWPAIGTLFALFAGISTYCWKANVSIHYESLYLLLASAFFHLLVKGARLRFLLPVFALALGTRPDAGAFLALQMGAILALPGSVLPAPPGGKTARRALAPTVAALAGTGILYTLIVIKLISPAFGIGEKTHAIRLWSHLGDSYGTIALQLLTHPSELWDALRGGAFLKLNQSLLLLPLLHPAGWIANIPGFVFYTTNDPSHRLLEFYNSAMLMPGLFLGAACGLGTLLKLAERARTKAQRAAGAKALLALLLAAAAFAAGFASELKAFREMTGVRHGGGISPEQGARQLAWIRRLLADCPKIRAVATDFQTSTFVPGRAGIALLRNAAKADAVVFAPEASAFLSGAGSLAELESRLRSELAPFREGEGLKALVRPGFCAPARAERGAYDGG